jgi:hypothetical protein
MPRFKRLAGVPLKRGVRRALFWSVLVLGLLGCRPTQIVNPKRGTAPAPSVATPGTAPRVHGADEGKPSDLLTTFVLAHPEAVAVSGDVNPPVLVDRSDDFHPVRVGIYLFEIVIDERGVVTDAISFRNTSGRENRSDEDKILSAIRHWRYRPATKKSKPVAVHLTVSVNVCG